MKPKGCPKAYTKADWLRVARGRVYDGKLPATDFELKTLKRVGGCQANPNVKPKLRKLRKAFRVSHLERMWSQGVGAVNRVYRAHGLYERGEFMRFGMIRRVFEAVGATPAQAYEFATIARGESGGGRWGGFPGILGIDGWVVPGATSVGIGLVQCTPAVWGKVALDHLAQLANSTKRAVMERALRNPLIQAWQAMALYRWAGNSFSPWYGTRYFAYAPARIRSALTAGDRRWLSLGGLYVLRTK
ncbi:MAG TPA: hypothetical protein VGF45_02325 [Polyangia bacterium]